MKAGTVVAIGVDRRRVGRDNSTRWCTEVGVFSEARIAPVLRGMHPSPERGEEAGAAESQGTTQCPPRMSSQPSSSLTSRQSWSRCGVNAEVEVGAGELAWVEAGLGCEGVADLVRDLGGRQSAQSPR
jgi:hypothetical protein